MVKAFRVKQVMSHLSSLDFPITPGYILNLLLPGRHRPAVPLLNRLIILSANLLSSTVWSSCKVRCITSSSTLAWTCLPLSVYFLELLQWTADWKQGLWLVHSCLSLAYWRSCLLMRSGRCTAAHHWHSWDTATSLCFFTRITLLDTVVYEYSLLSQEPAGSTKIDRLCCTCYPTPPSLARCLGYLSYSLQHDRRGKEQRRHACIRCSTVSS